MAARGRSNELAMQGARALGWSDSHFMRRYAKGCVGSGQCIQGCREGKKQSLNVTYVPELRQRGGQVLSCAPVERVLLDGGRAVGVTGHFQHPVSKARGPGFTVRARRGVVVAASVTHSPVLLHRSGVRPWALGRFFRAHPGTGVFGVYADVVDHTRGATQGWASMSFRQQPGLKLESLAIPPELVASRLAGGGEALMKRLGEYRHLAMWLHAVRAESIGRVHAPLVGTQPVVRYSLDAADMLRFREGIKLVAAQHFAAGARKIFPGIAGFPAELSADQLPLLDDAPLDPRAYVAIVSHLFGGCVMGADPARSVVDGHGRVHGVKGLVVADASVIPTNLGVNPQHTIMALAAIFAEDALGS